MKKNSIYLIGVYLAFPIIFNVLFFLYVGTDNAISVWLSYAFIHVAYILLFLTQFYVPNTKKNYEIGMGLNAISLIYFIIELIVGIYFISAKDDSFINALAVQLIILVAYIFVLSANLIAKDHTISNNIKNTTSNVTINNMLLNLSECKNIYRDDVKVQKQLNYLYDLLNSSARKFTDETRMIDEKIEKAIIDLTNAKYGDDTDELLLNTKYLEDLINSRNRIVNLSN